LKDTKLIYALSHLDVYELNKFKKFVNSPYFNSNKNLIRYFEILETILKKKKKEPSKKLLFKKIFGDIPFNDNKLRKLNTEILSLFEEFLSVEHFTSKKLTKVNHLLVALRERRLDKMYNNILVKSKRYSEQSFSKTSDFYVEQFHLQKNIFNLTSEDERKAKSKENLSDFNIAEISYNLDLFYIIEKLRYMCTVLSWQRLRDHKTEINFIDDIIKIVENSALLRNRVVEIYYQIYMTHINEDDESHYFKLKKLIKKYLNIFPLTEAKEIFGSAFTYCVGRGNKGHHKFQNEVLELYKYALENELLITDGILSPTTFRNITTYALRLKEYTWAEEFINRYKVELNPKYAESVTSFNLALLNFYKKNYSEVIDYLVGFEYDEISYALAAKNLLLSTYYELDEDDALFSFLGSFQAFVNRNQKLTEFKKIGYRNLINFTRKMVNVNQLEKNKVLKIKEEISKTKVVASRQWLLDKVEELL
jgi:hypothetical protein